jgi:rubrerythrin
VKLPFLFESEISKVNSQLNPIWLCSNCRCSLESIEKPEICPVCRASKDQFSLLPIQPEIPAAAWQCKECGFIHYGSEAPEFCPVCGFPAHQFEPLKIKKRAY